MHFLQVMLNALTDSSSKECKTGTFNIDHKCATLHLTRFFIDCMYEGWTYDKMDDDANELLQLAHFYECDRIVDMATEALIRFVTFSQT